MNGNKVRDKYFQFFKSKKHIIIPSSPLVPVDDPTTLFTSSGMQPLVPYLKGQAHPMGKRLCNSQPCFRAEDIFEVGDSRHTTFFEMLGNWSLGDYFKERQLSWFFEFLTKELGLDQKKLFVTVFEGDDQVSQDKDSIKIWQELFNTKKPAAKGNQGFDPEVKIYTYSGLQNWWSRAGPPEKMPAGEIGGPDSEVFYDFGQDLKLHQNSSSKDQTCHLNCGCGRFLEIGNSVFMEYEKQKDGSFKPLPNKNVDFGGGLERITAACQNQADIFKIDLFLPLIQEIEKDTGKKYKGQFKKPMQIISDHLKASTFMISQGVEPSNKRQGYLLRRLLRRAAIKMHQLKGKLDSVSAFQSVCHQVIKVYQDVYFEDKQTKSLVDKVVDEEIRRFSKTLDHGLKIIEKAKPEEIDSKFSFNLFQTYGFPFEITCELLTQKGFKIDKKEFDKELKKHQELSRTASKGMFKGGLANHSEDIKKLHTATHLLHQALRKVLGEDVKQVGSNITKERLRFDFTHPKALTKEEIKTIEALVNQQIKDNLKVISKTLTLKEAKEQGALAFFGQKYANKVKVYKVGDFSYEVCGGPHVDFTGELGRFTIKKEESSGSGKRRVYGVLKNGT